MTRLTAAMLVVAVLPMGCTESVPDDDRATAEANLLGAGGRFHCADIRDDRWSPLPGLEYTGRFGILLPPAPNGEVTLIAGDDQPLVLEAETSDGLPLPIQIERLASVLVSALPADYWIEYGTPWAVPQALVRAIVVADRQEKRVVSVRFNRRAPRVLARQSGFPPRTLVRICAADNP